MGRRPRVCNTDVLVLESLKWPCSSRSYILYSKQERLLGASDYLPSVVLDTGRQKDKYDTVEELGEEEAGMYTAVVDCMNTTILQPALRLVSFETTVLSRNFILNDLKRDLTVCQV